VRAGTVAIALIAPPSYAIFMTSELENLRAMLLAAQRSLIMAAAEAGVLPSDNSLRKIADIEVTIGAIEAMIDIQPKG